MCSGFQEGHSAENVENPMFSPKNSAPGALPEALCCPSPACRARPEIAILFRRGSRRPPEARQLVVPRCVAEVALEEIAADVAHLAEVVGVLVPPESMCIDII